MTHSFDALFAPTSVPLVPLIERAAEVLLNEGLVFNGQVWQLQSPDRPPADRVPTLHTIASLSDVAAATSSWWGRSLEWISPELGEVYLRIWPAGPGTLHVVYNECQALLEMRERDATLRERLVSMLLRFMGIVDSPICVYQSESTQKFQAPKLSTVDEALQAGDRWQGDIVIVDSAILDPARLAAFAERDEFIRHTTDGKIILDYLEARSR